MKTKVKLGRPATLPGRLGEFAAHVGGVALLASILKVSERTIRRWANDDSEVRPPMRAHVNSVAQRRRFGLVFE